MIKIVQYGEGNFLRSFVDLYFETLGGEGGDYKVNVVKPIPFGSVEKFQKQNCKYHVVLRGFEVGETVEKAYKVNAIESVIDPFIDQDKYYDLARDEQLKIIVSNTTEAGIAFCANDKYDGFDNITYPAKLTKFLFERFRSGGKGVYILPCELIDGNADELKKCVDAYIELWKLPLEFKKWNDEKNYYCNTLVDRIVSGYPKSERDLVAIEKIIGGKDELVSVGEPFGLWAVERKGELEKYVKSGAYNIEVVLTDDIAYYKKRKVRVLNGSHTNIVPVGLWQGAVTVYDCMQDEKLRNFLLCTLKNEIVPFVGKDITATEEFASSVIDRFSNPYLNHLLTSISLNSISKWRARNLPSFKDYYNQYGVIAPSLTVGFSYLMAIYQSVKKTDDRYIAFLPSREIDLVDDSRYLDYFASGKSLLEFMQDKSVWGEDLTLYDGFYESVSKNVEKIKKGISLV